MEHTITIRKAASEDLNTIFGFICHLEETAFNFEQFQDNYEVNIQHPDFVYLVAVNESGEALGFISCHGNNPLHQGGPAFQIQEIYVARNYRDRGIGKQLLAALEEKLSGNGPQCLDVAMDTKRTDARKFFYKAGFQQTGVKLVKK